MQKSQQQPLATLAQGHRDKVRGRGEGERARESVCVFVFCRKKERKNGCACVCNGRERVRENIFVLWHKGFKIRYKGVCVHMTPCVCMYKAQGDM